MNKYLSRKFIIAMIFTVSACIGFLATGKLTGAEFVTLALGIPGLFTAGDVAIKHVMGKDAE